MWIYWGGGGEEDGGIAGFGEGVAETAGGDEVTADEISWCVVDVWKGES